MVASFKKKILSLRITEKRDRQREKKREKQGERKKIEYYLSKCI